MAKTAKTQITVCILAVFYHVLLYKNENIES